MLPPPKKKKQFYAIWVTKSMSVKILLIFKRVILLSFNIEHISNGNEN